MYERFATGFMGGGLMVCVFALFRQEWVNFAWGGGLLLASISCGILAHLKGKRIDTP